MYNLSSKCFSIGSNPGSVIFVMDFRSISLQCIVGHRFETQNFVACLAQSVERQALNLMVVGSSPTVGAFYHQIRVWEFDTKKSLEVPVY